MAKFKNFHIIPTTQIIAKAYFYIWMRFVEDFEESLTILSPYTIQMNYYLVVT